MTTAGGRPLRADARRNWARVLDAAEAVFAAGIDIQTAAAGEARERADALALVLTRAQQAGAVREDVGLPELVAALVGASRAAEHAGAVETRSRVIGLILAGLKPTNP